MVNGTVYVAKTDNGYVVTNKDASGHVVVLGKVTQADIDRLPTPPGDLHPATYAVEEILDAATEKARQSGPFR